MSNEELFNQYTVMMRNEEAVEAIKAANSAEEIRAIFRANGLVASDEDLDGIIAAMIEMSKKPRPTTESEEAELNLVEMQQVAGGDLSWKDLGKIATMTWEAGTWIAGKLVYGSQAKAKSSILKFWLG